MGKFEYDDIEKRILSATEELVLRFGPDKTTMDEIAREADISRSTLYTAVEKEG